MKYIKPKTQEVQVQSMMHWNKFTLGFRHLTVVLLETVLYALSEPPFRWDRPILPARETAAGRPLQELLS